MALLANYVSGQWVTGSGAKIPLFDPVTGNELATVSSDGLDYGAALEHARSVGGPALRSMSYQERAQLLERIVQVLSAKRAAYYQIALENSGSPKADAAIDIEGALFTLKYFARLGSALGPGRFLQEGDSTSLAKNDVYQSLHLGTPLKGAAVLINAFNFPSWGLWEKAAVALLSGVPVFAKPAAATAWLAHRMVEDVVSAGVLPAGTLSLSCGRAGDLLDHVDSQDVVLFTGSAETAQRIRAHAAITARSARVNIEADSLNAAILGPDATAAAEITQLFVREVVRELTIKAGQKCTAIRRIFVPQHLLDEVTEALGAQLSKIVVGDPRDPSVQMGPLVSREQQAAVEQGIMELTRESTVAVNGTMSQGIEKGAFVNPTLLLQPEPYAAKAVHHTEVFGPVATLMPYDDTSDAMRLASMGRGSLVCSLFSDDPDFIQSAASELAADHGRVHVVTTATGSSHTGHGTVMPMSIHGGPGRAGGGQELGGLRALRLFHQFSAIQAPPDSVRRLTQRAVSYRP
jgi:3,4-dehydroadipyl-CoA semialdehyde dehydrogenase